jgi:hypothetical protein|tara:strand:- start:172 stop:345 length:174 start_codon:yes stop_codon:yes gene_type:complete
LPFSNVNGQELKDVMEKVIYSSKKSDPINVRGFVKGIYLLRIASGEGGVLSNKLIVN